MRVVRRSFDEIAGSHSEGLLYDLLLNIPLPRARLSGKFVVGMELLENKRFCRGGRIPHRTRDCAGSRVPKFSLSHSVPGPPVSLATRREHNGGLSTLSVGSIFAGMHWPVMFLRGPTDSTRRDKVLSNSPSNERWKTASDSEVGLLGRSGCARHDFHNLRLSARKLSEFPGPQAAPRESGMDVFAKTPLPQPLPQKLSYGWRCPGLLPWCEPGDAFRYS